MTAAEKLVQWRLGKGLSQRQAAKLMGRSHVTWHSWENGGLPATNLAVELERVTEGAVAVTDWAESEEARAVKRARTKARRVLRRHAAAG